MSEHTEGKWEATIINDMVYIVSAHKEIAIICVKPDAGHLYKPAEMEANAQLVANAPETLEQRDALLTACEAALEFIGRSSKTDWDNVITPVLTAAIDLCKPSQAEAVSTTDEV